MKNRNNQVWINVSVALVFLAIMAVPVWMAYMPYKSAGKTHNITPDAALEKYGFYLEEISKQSGVDFKHQSPVLDTAFNPILPQIASMGASVAVSDYDNDGWNDFYVTNSRYGSKNALFHNQKNGSFIDVAEKYGIADINVEGTGVSMGAVWADYDNDGFEDLFVYKWGRPQLFRNEHGTGFTDVTEKSGLPGWVNSNTAIWFDYNSDGLVDLFIGGYFPEDVDLWHLRTTRVLTESFEYSQNGGRNYLFENKGNGYFIDVTTGRGLVSTRWTLSAGALDINKDGYPELIIANDYGIDEFYINEKGKQFIEKSNNTMIGFSPKSGMNVSFGDTYNKGKFGIYISNITEDGILMQGNNFWIPVLDKNKILYINAAKQNGIESAGWSYGAQFGDLNNDGYIDLYVANGYISGQNGTSYWYDYSKVTGGNTAIISDVKNWPAMKGRSQSGYQENKIWINDGAGHFSDVAGYVVNDQPYDSRAVAFADLWNRGVLDVIVANQNNSLRIYKNKVISENQWIVFELKGKESNHSAIGAIVELYWNSSYQSQTVTGGIGFCSQNQRRLHFGLGKNAKIDRAVIIWPDGLEQTIENPEAMKLYKITESEGYANELNEK